MLNVLFKLAFKYFLDQPCRLGCPQMEACLCNRSAGRSTWKGISFTLTWKSFILQYLCNILSGFEVERMRMLAIIDDVEI